MQQEPMWQIVPREMTREMELAAKAAQQEGKDLAGQYQAALAAHAKACAGRTPSRKSNVSVERGEELLEDLEAGISSIAARALFQHILAAEKKQALAIMRDEQMSEQDAEDLYAYCRAKWLTAKLVVVEVPQSNIVEFVREEDARARQARADRPQYLLRQGLSVIPCSPRLQEDPITFLTSRDEIELKEIKQLWLVTPQP